ncbi:MAG: helix-turn-helix transcriptional regulator [Clostridiales bacterium]|uniref:helix-turn-helix domain-containing protein n=1 Tax=Zhenhengia sp. TaxID=2944208 RepID=UPI00206FC959|nr:helix-turn-helix transcriptional regulator [Clostridiales bacterium]MDU6361704.1 helix-turn-helix transcriptional regulator [Clostridiales bacterium]DAV40115.1 MAG TPA: Cro/C1-type HTH DNA-binding domain protein [Caudoviricetes sp.]
MIKNRISEELDRQGKSMYWLAQETQTSYPTIHKLSNNKTESIKFDTLERICRALNCSIGDLFTISD